MTRIRVHFGRGALVLSAAICTLLAPGCHDSEVGTLYPVHGKATIKAAPLTAKTTVILFKPNAARGNKSSFEPAGTVDADGNYTLLTKGRQGAPPGWYKVVVTATEMPPAVPIKGSATHRPLPKSLVPAKYGQAKTTPLEIEVVESPAAGAYDLKLTQ